MPGPIAARRPPMAPQRALVRMGGRANGRRANGRQVAKPPPGARGQGFCAAQGSHSVTTLRLKSRRARLARLRRPPCASTISRTGSGRGPYLLLSLSRTEAEHPEARSPRAQGRGRRPRSRSFHVIADADGDVLGRDPIRCILQEIYHHRCIWLASQVAVREGSAPPRGEMASLLQPRAMNCDHSTGAGRGRGQLGKTR